MTEPGKLTLSLTACNGKFGVGMTRNQFQDNKDIKIFDEIDKNGNHKLEDFEICDYREKEAKKNKWLAVGEVICSVIFGGAAVLTPPYSTTGIEVGVSIGWMGLAVNDANTAHETDKLIDEYRKQHGL